MFFVGLAAVESTGLPIELTGNLVLDEQVYLAVLELPAESTANATTAVAVETQLSAFLLRAGYTLATVRVALRDGRLRVIVDEGRLVRIVIRGRGTLTALRLRWELNLPHQVFNRPALERQLRELAARHNLTGLTYALRPTTDVAHLGPQFERVELAGRSLPLGGQHELWIELPRADWYPGLRALLTFESSAAMAGLGLRDSELLWPGDRFELETAAGARLRGNTDGTGQTINFHRGGFMARYATPPLWQSGLRPTVALRTNIARPVRADLGLDHYWFDEVEGRLGLSYELDEGLETSFGLGLVQRDLFAPAPTAPDARVAVFSELRPFLAAEVDLILDPWLERRDRQHRLRLRGRQLFGAGAMLGAVELDYRKVWALGWHDLWARGAGAWRFGERTVADQIPLSSRFLRGVFGEEIFAEQIMAVGADLRFSLSRDLFKVGLFHDLALWLPARGSASGSWRTGNAFGPSLHALLLDAVQLDLYLTLGFVFAGRFDYGASVSLSKAF